MVTVTLLSGLAGGLVATILMTVFMLTLGDDSPPPTAALWAKFVGSAGPEAYVPQGMVLHLLYGVGAGAAFALALPLVVGEVSLATAVALALAYAVGLTIVGAVVWMKGVLGVDPDRATAMQFGFFHLVYGLVLGGFLGAGVV
ncbi:hypothetical protein [Haloarchaeobius iranensis]|uniref:DUF1761 domain-containing protein n=1 Tax=Haloarchaeobius iranensis TaxID=996166 RepID=A0A1G9WWE9_9EURY|nr:hypothetical protein [Haloarchaeobius iranensis]SDM88797.1 hypothetical protein SAMN05192554_10920 [Haloarchaeobius iranensis]